MENTGGKTGMNRKLKNPNLLVEVGSTAEYLSPSTQKLFIWGNVASLETGRILIRQKLS